MNNRLLATSILALLMCLSKAGQPELQAEVATWDAPNLDSWTYPVAADPGGGIYGPTFLSEPGLDEFDQFLPQTGRDPMRRGMTFTGFATATDITPSLLPARYQVNSVTVTFRLGETSLGGSILYDDTPETNAELLSDYVNGNIDTARPIEMYGAGFQAGYTGFDFATNPGDKSFSESTYPYQDPDPENPTPTTGDDVLAVYPLGSDGSGQYVDVSNSLSGGFSATAPGNTTSPFEPTPWAIGAAAGLNPGDAIPDEQTLSFSFDLGLPGVAEYMQQGLADGALGFYLTSQHFAGDFHSGNGVPYPRWFTKEFPTIYGGEAPTLAIDYSILSSPGDFDSDGDVDSMDLAQWQDDYGNNGDSDADLDGDSDGIDFLAWQRNHTGALPLSTIVGTVPEPSSASLALMSLAFLAARRPKRKCHSRVECVLT